MTRHGRGPGLWDRGAQPERTALAWSRTTLALVVAGLFCVRLAPSAFGAATAAAVRVRGRRAPVAPDAREPAAARHRLARGERVADPGSVLLATGVTILLAFVGILFAV
ncbi:hypothetical protein BJF79_25190 [Actinomadura sp. CNU-125]|nr:hypothetical protein BJF79_25190 [Actinomadura sp. CNU-125]